MNSDKIIVDSCCDLTAAMRREMNVETVPLTMMLGDAEYVDDESLDLPGFMRAMKACKKKVGSASPPPILYQEAVQNAGGEYIITLSGRLSGSYSAAVLGNRQAEEESGRAAHVFDSKSASAGETLIAIKLYELLKEGLPKTRVVQRMHSFIDGMKTYFVLENYDNLQKNGRLGRITGSLIHMLGIKLIMGADGEGNIALYEKVRGMKRALGNLVELVEKSGKAPEGENLVIAHNGNPESVGELAAAIRERYDFKGVYVVPTGGLSSLYTDDKGIVMAF